MRWWLTVGNRGERLLRVSRYGLGLAGVVIPTYLFAGVVIAGQTTPESFVKWINSYGNLGTWGLLTADTPANTLSGISAALSAEFWTGRALVVLLFWAALALASRSIRRGGAFAWALWAWTGIYLAFFAWWQPEVLKFWVLLLPVPLLLLTMSLDWQRLARQVRTAALSASAIVLASLLLTNAPAIWAKRDPLSDPARQVSNALSRLTGPEDLIVLQASGAEHYLPFYYNRINVVSTRELWYLHGGASGRGVALGDIKQRTWHALAKGASVWIEDRVLTPGEQAGDHYVFTDGEVRSLLTPYERTVSPQEVATGPSLFYKLSPLVIRSTSRDWQFATNQLGWSGVNVTSESFSAEGWCFTPLEDPSVYGPPLQLHAPPIKRIEISMSSGIKGRAQLFYRSSPDTPYSEEQSVAFDIEQGDQTYSITSSDASGWGGTVASFRLDPVERGIPGASDNRVCVKRIQLIP